MPLSNQQIERYSRQLIVEGVGGIAQERLLASRVALIGSTAEVERALRYLVGAGVGSIHLIIDDATSLARMIDNARAANADVNVQSDASSPDIDLIFALIGSGEALSLTESFAEQHRQTPTIWVRLDTPERLAILRDPNICYQCAHPNLIGPFDRRGANAGFVTMVAATEAIALLIGGQDKALRLIEFDGYASRSTPLAPDQSSACACRQVSP